MSNNIRESQTPGVETYFLSTILTTLFSAGFIFMLTSTYNMEIAYSDVLGFIFFASLVSTVVHSIRKDIIWSILYLILIPAVFMWFMSTRTHVSRNVCEYVLWILQKYAFRGFNFDFRYAEFKNEDVTGFFMLISLIPIAFTSFAIVRRRLVWLAIITILPFLIPSVMLHYRFPNQIWCEIAATCVIILIIGHNLRRAPRKESHIKLLIAIVPVLAVNLVIGFIFPLETYDKDELARRQLTSIADMLSEFTLNSQNPYIRKINGYLQRYTSTEAKARASESNSNTVGIDYSVSSGDTDLSKAGHFNPPWFRIMNIIRIKDPGYKLEPAYQGKYLYLKTSSKDIYEDNMWKSSYLDPLPLINNSQQVNYSPFYYVISYVPNAAIDLAPSPLYTDHYTSQTVDGRNHVPFHRYSEFRREINRVNDLSESVFITTDADDVTPDENGFYPIETGLNGDASYFAASNIPLRNAIILTPDCRDYIYGTNLVVPESTRNELIDSGALPDWYMSLLNGETTMTDADKVRAVMTYLRNLHPYDANTEYPPEDRDFVPWFITEGQTGICVHYASSAVILLRMLGIPARYTEGFIISTISTGNTVPVSPQESHAWVEFYLPEFGWVMDDPTPGGEVSADHFNINAIAEIYPEYAQQSSVYQEEKTLFRDDALPTFVQDPETPASEDSGIAEEKTAVSDQFEIPIFSTIARYPVVSIILYVILGIALIRLSYLLYWSLKFNEKSINNRARARYRYYALISRSISTVLPENIKAIAGKAAFSSSGIDEDEFKILLDNGENFVKQRIKSMSALKRFFYGFLVVDLG